jgi:hypothetical protein
LNGRRCEVGRQRSRAARAPTRCCGPAEPRDAARLTEAGGHQHNRDVKHSERNPRRGDRVQDKDRNAERSGRDGKNLGSGFPRGERLTRHLSPGSCWCCAWLVRHARRSCAEARDIASSQFYLRPSWPQNGTRAFLGWKPILPWVTSR